ncbi:MAG: hypothetical protein ACR2OB_08090 [Solirubrobacteraceae bacterium]
MATKLKDSAIRIDVRGDAATAVAAAGPQGYGGQLRKINGKWLISKFASP